MRRLSAVAAVVLVTGAAMGQEAADIPIAPIVPGLDKDILVNPADFDISGVWEYSSDIPTAGILEITAMNGAVALELVSGAVCEPETMCSFDGAIQDKALVVSNSAIVDDEGGSATNALAIYFLSETDAMGSGSSRYVHPTGYEKQWSYTLNMHRPKLKDGEWEPGASRALD